ncbi:MAG: hypothetical protein WAV32_03170 [Halobacteriota archaeon]
MVEDLGSVLRKGFETWKKNLSICLPFVFSMILTTMVAIIIIGGAILAAVPSLTSLIPYVTAPEKISPELILPLLHQFIQNIGIIIAAVIITVILTLLINAFFTAGAIGMAKEATEKGRTSLSEMKEYGRRKFSSLLGADVIVSLIALVGFVFIIPGILYTLPKISTSSEPAPAVVSPALAIIVVGLLVMVIYMLLISIIFALPLFAVVIDDLGAVEGVKRGFNFFMMHKMDVFLLWLVTLAIAVVVGFILANIPYAGQLLNMVVSVIVIQPLTVIWWSRLYLSMTKPKTDDVFTI